MKMSIRTRLFLATGFLIVFFVTASWLLNTQFLGKYYLSQKRHTLLKSKIMIEKIYQGDPEAVALELENLERNRGLNIILFNPNNEPKYSSFTGRLILDFRERRPERPPFIRSFQVQLDQLSPGEFILDIAKDPRLGTQFLFLMSRLDNGEILMLSTPLAAIEESTAIANRFLLFTGLITIILGGIAVFFFANRFTKPILELNDIALSMSRLDFSKKYPVQTEDEIGQLGRSINSLSDQLDEAVHELQEANSKLKEDIERERQLDKMRKEFVSSVSHELKTPIALIQGYAEGLKLNVNEDEESKEFYCEVIMDEADKMNRLVKDLLELSQVESGHLQLERTVFDLSTLVDHVIDKYQPILQEKEVKLEVDKHDHIAVDGDMVRIEQVLVNYLTNAINHVDENKFIRIKVAALQDKVRVSVFNSGKNIPEESLDKIWTSFYKVDKARTRAYGGTGLGLSVVRAIMELHHNGYDVENNENGVTFWFEVDRILSSDGV